MNWLIVTATLFLTLVPAAAQTPAPSALSPTSSAANIIAEVRGLIAKDDFSNAEKTLREFIANRGTTPDSLEALSWLGRGALAKQNLDEANRFADETYALCLQALKTRQMDDEPRLPIAIGAAIEVQAGIMGQHGQRAEAVYFLQRELDKYGKTSIRTRIQKNINILTLEGKPAPAWDVGEYVGAKPPTIKELRGRPAIVFFWAHWCPDCKAMAPLLAEMQAKYKKLGLVVVAPTQRYGYVAKRAPADARTEMEYIGQVAKEFYSAVDWTIPVSAESFSNYGSSTTPTVVLVDRQGVVRLYHPGQMKQAELEPWVQAVVEGRRRPRTASN
jgi:thiol-disulfide isomerase/thioredoxin